MNQPIADRPATESWRDLFESPAAGQPAIEYAFLELRKHGEPLLLLPLQPRAARHALELYPAQRWPARLAKGLLRLALHLPAGLPTRRVRLILSANDPLLRLIMELAGGGPWAIFAGNPSGADRRFVLLLFDRSEQPRWVIKAGVSSVARERIHAELSLLQSVPAGTEGVPRLQREFRSDRLSAFVLAHYPGRIPRPSQYAQSAQLLHSWLDLSHTVSIGELAAWQRLRNAVQAEPVFQRLAGRLESCRVRPALFHGDFAPWNVKVSPADERWMVLDWERGELVGPPGWDWIHFWLQPAVLVRRWSAARLAVLVEQVVQSDAFHQYAQTAGFAARRREMALAYLLYWLAVLRAGPYEAIGRQTLQVLTEKWLGD